MIGDARAGGVTSLDRHRYISVLEHLDVVAAITDMMSVGDCAEVVVWLEGTPPRREVIGGGAGGVAAPPLPERNRTSGC